MHSHHYTNINIHRKNLIYNKRLFPILLTFAIHMNSTHKHKKSNRFRLKCYLSYENINDMLTRNIPNFCTHIITQISVYIARIWFTTEDYCRFCWLSLCKQKRPNIFKLIRYRSYENINKMLTHSRNTTNSLF